MPIKPGIKCGVQYGENLSKLLIINQETPLVMYIKEVCKEFQLGPSKDYCLVVNTNPPTLLTESNRERLTNGHILYLRVEPSIAASNLLTSISSGNSNAALEALRVAQATLQDASFADALIKEKAVDRIVEILVKPNAECKELTALLLQTFYVLAESASSPSVLNTLPEPFIQMILTMIGDKTIDFSILKHALDIGFLIMCNNRNRRSSMLQKVDPHLLIHHLHRFKDMETNVDQLREVQRSLLCLLNDFFERHVSMEDFITKIPTYLGTSQLQLLTDSIPSLNVKESDPATVLQLVRLQQYLLQSVLIEAMASVDPNDPITAQNMTNLCTILDSPDNTEPPQSLEASVYALSKGNNKDSFKKLGFQNYQNPYLDFSEKPPGRLAFKCIHYFAYNYEEEAEAILDLNLIGNPKRFPVIQGGKVLTKTLFDIFKVDSQLGSYDGPFCPMIFNTPHNMPMEEVFSAAFVLFHRTWHEMEAVQADMDNVVIVLRKQLIRAISMRPLSIDEFKKHVLDVNSCDINSSLLSGKTHVDGSLSQVPAIIELRSILEANMIELVKRRRLRSLEKGGDFQVHSVKERSRPFKENWTLQLTSNHKALIQTHTEGTLNEKPVLYHLSQLKSIQPNVIGPLINDRRLRQNNKLDLCFTLELLVDLDRADEATFHLTLVAKTPSQFDTWMDGLNILTSKSMSSALYHKELDVLLGLEMKIRLLDIDSSKIPSEPPVIPPPPPNIDHIC